MSQSTLEVPNQARSTYRAAVNDALQALASCFSGANAPSETYAYMFWADTTSGLLKQRNAADDDWVEILDLATGAPVQLPVAAGQSEMEAGTEDGLRLMSPLRVAQAVAAQDLPAANLTGDVAAARITDALNASGSAPVYACRAWVNFDGTTNTGGNCDIRASGNVSSVTDNGVGDYTINFATAMQDNDYVFAGTIGFGATNSACQTVRLYEGSNVDSVMTANGFRFKTVQTTDVTSVLIDPQYCGVSVFR